MAGQADATKIVDLGTWTPILYKVCFLQNWCSNIRLNYCINNFILDILFSSSNLAKRSNKVEIDQDKIDTVVVKDKDDSSGQSSSKIEKDLNDTGYIVN